MPSFYKAASIIMIIFSAIVLAFAVNFLWIELFTAFLVSLLEFSSFFGAPVLMFVIGIVLLICGIFGLSASKTKITKACIVFGIISVAVSAFGLLYSVVTGDDYMWIYAVGLSLTVVYLPLAACLRRS